VTASVVIDAGHVEGGAEVVADVDADWDNVVAVAVDAVNADQPNQPTGSSPEVDFVESAMIIADQRMGEVSVSVVDRYEVDRIGEPAAVESVILSGAVLLPLIGVLPAEEQRGKKLVLGVVLWRDYW